jgi:hypothetical protein
VYTDHKSLK